MPLTLLGDLKHYENYVRTGYVQGIVDRINVFNSRSGGTIRLTSEFTTGMEKNIAFWEDFGVMTRRDISVDTAQTPHKIERDEYHAFKTFWKFEPVNFQLSAFKTADGMSENDVYVMIGRKLAEKKLDFAVKQALMIASAAITSGGAAVNLDYTVGTPENFTVDKVVEAVSLYGDRASNLKALVMHSAVYFPLIKDQIVNYQFDTGAGLRIQGGSPATYGLPVIVTDNPELVYKDENGDTFYKTLLLANNAVTLSDNGYTKAAYGLELGKENITSLFQAEGDMWNSILGYTYTGSDRNANPVFDNLADPDNWVRWENSHKLTAGVLIKSMGSIRDARRNVIDVRVVTDTPAVDTGTDTGNGT